MKKFILILAAIISLGSSLLYSQGGWIVQYPFNSSDQLLSLQFLNANTGYVTGENSIIKTTNGGNNWININSISGSGYNSIYFLNQNTGFIGGRNASSIARILKTTNGGQNWIALQTGVNDNGLYENIVYTIYAFDENTIIIGDIVAASNGRIYKTTNGGNNWVQAFSDAYKGIRCIKFVNNQIGYACGSSFWKTTDQGDTWIEKSIPLSYTAYSLCFPNENTGYITRSIGTIQKTTNGGDNWIEQIPYLYAGLFSVSFINVNTGMVSGDWGTILRTTNGGNNWLNISVPFDNLGGIQMLNADTIFSAGWFYDSAYMYRSIVIKSFTGGLTGISHNSNEVPTKYSLGQNYPNPFNPMTNVKFSIVNAGDVKIVVYDVQGREVQTLVNEKLSAGTYEVKFDGSMLTSGVYFYRLFTDGFSDAKKMLLIK